MDTQSSQKRSPRDSAKSKQQTTVAPEAEKKQRNSYSDHDDEQHFDRSLDHVARVRAAKEAAQRKMEEFGDASEYDITIMHGQLKKVIDGSALPTFDFKPEKGES